MKRSLTILLMAIIFSKLVIAGADYENLETIVRLKASHGRDKGYSDYLGLSLMLETRNKGNKEPVWAADLTFGPKDSRSEIFYDASDMKWNNIYPSMILLRYVNVAHYSDQNRSYGTRVDSITDPANPSGHPLKTDLDETNTKQGKPTFKIQNIDWNYTKNEVERNNHKDWLKSSLFEWKLSDTLTISDLKSIVKDYTKLSYKYTMAGFSCENNVINCCQFSCMVLKKLGINIDSSEYIKNYVTNKYGFYSLPVLNYLPFVLSGGRGGSFKPEYVIEEILENIDNIPNTKIVIINVDGILDAATKSPHSLLAGFIEIDSQNIYFVHEKRTLFSKTVKKLMTDDKIGEYRG